MSMHRATSYNDSPFGLSASYVHMAKEIKVEDEAYWRDHVDQRAMQGDPANSISPCEEQ